MRHVLTHWVSQACLHLIAPLTGSELLDTNLHRHLFNVSTSCHRTLYVVATPISQEFQNQFQLPVCDLLPHSARLDDIVPTSKCVVFMLPSFHCHFWLFYCSVQWASKYILLGFPGQHLLGCNVMNCIDTDLLSLFLITHKNVKTSINLDFLYLVEPFYTWSLSSLVPCVVLRFQWLQN
jgi:hypothetical protein